MQRSLTMSIRSLLLLSQLIVSCLSQYVGGMGSAMAVGTNSPGIGPGAGCAGGISVIPPPMVLRPDCVYGPGYGGGYGCGMGSAGGYTRYGDVYDQTLAYGGGYGQTPGYGGVYGQRYGPTASGIVYGGEYGQTPGYGGTYGQGYGPTTPGINYGGGYGQAVGYAGAYGQGQGPTAAGIAYGGAYGQTAGYGAAYGQGYGNTAAGMAYGSATAGSNTDIYGAYGGYGSNPSPYPNTPPSSALIATPVASINPLVPSAQHPGSSNENANTNINVNTQFGKPRVGHSGRGFPAAPQ